MSDKNIKGTDLYKIQGGKDYCEEVLGITTNEDNTTPKYGGPGFDPKNIFCSKDLYDPKKNVNLRTSPYCKKGFQ